jgi:hypothetical protein
MKKSLPKPLCRFVLIALSAGLTFLGCTKNLFDELADKSDPDATVFEARRALNKRQYTEAIALMSDLPAEYLAREDVNFLLASAYAGRCGLEILDLAFELQDLDGGQFMKLLMQLFKESTPDRADDCIQAEALLVASGTASERSKDENLLLSFVSLTKLGAILNAFADQDDDGQPDAGWNHCQEADFPEDYVREVGTALALFLESFGSVGADIAGGTMDGLEEACSQHPFLETACSKTDRTTYTADEIKALRMIVAAENFATVPTTVVGIGIGACSDLQTDCICL